MSATNEARDVHTPPDQPRHDPSEGDPWARLVLDWNDPAPPTAGPDPRSQYRAPGLDQLAPPTPTPAESTPPTGLPRLARSSQAPPPPPTPPPGPASSTEPGWPLGYPQTGASPGSTPRDAEDLLAELAARPTSPLQREPPETDVAALAAGPAACLRRVWSRRAKRADRYREYAELLRHLARPLDPSALPYLITAASLKGGVGKTTVSACLGLTLAEYRPDRVVAVDANLDAGTLADRLLNDEPPATVQHLLDDLTEGDEAVNSVAALGRYLGRARRLAVLAGHQDPRIGAAFADGDYATLISYLGRFFHLILADTGTGLVDGPMRAVLDRTHTLVLVATPTLDAARLADETLTLLAHDGYARLVDNSIAVLCHTATASGDPHAHAALRAQFVARCRAVIDIPADPHLADGALIDLTQLAAPTRHAYLWLAAAVIDAAPNPPSV